MNALARGLALLVLGWMVLGFGLCGAFGVLGGVVSLFGGSGRTSRASRCICSSTHSGRRH